MSFSNIDKQFVAKKVLDFNEAHHRELADTWGSEDITNEVFDGFTTQDLNKLVELIDKLEDNCVLMTNRGKS